MLYELVFYNLLYCEITIRLYCLDALVGSGMESTGTTG